MLLFLPVFVQSGPCYRQQPAGFRELPWKCLPLVISMRTVPATCPSRLVASAGSRCRKWNKGPESLYGCCWAAMREKFIAFRKPGSCCPWRLPEKICSKVISQLHIGLGITSTSEHQPFKKVFFRQHFIDGHSNGTIQAFGNTGGTTAATAAIGQVYLVRKAGLQDGLRPDRFQLPDLPAGMKGNLFRCGVDGGGGGRHKFYRKILFFDALPRETHQAKGKLDHSHK